MPFPSCTTLRNREENTVLSPGKHSSVLNGRFEQGKVYLREKDASQIIVKASSTHIPLNINGTGRELYFSIDVQICITVDRYIVIFKVQNQKATTALLI